MNKAKELLNILKTNEAKAIGNIRDLKRGPISYLPVGLTDNSKEMIQSFKKHFGDLELEYVDSENEPVSILTLSKEFVKESEFDCVKDGEVFCTIEYGVLRLSRNKAARLEYDGVEAMFYEATPIDMDPAGGYGSHSHESSSKKEIFKKFTNPLTYSERDELVDYLNGVMAWRQTYNKDYTISREQIKITSDKWDNTQEKELQKALSHFNIKLS